MALPDLTGQNIQDTYQRVLQIGTGGTVFDGTGSLPPVLQVTASHAISASVEITHEVSSSHAQTADSASYVLAANIDQPFGNISSTGEISASNFKIPGLTISDQILSLVDEVRFIGGSKIKGTGNGIEIVESLFGNDDRNLFLGNLTASAAISASGNIYANKFYVNNGEALSPASGDANKLSINQGGQFTSIGIGRGNLAVPVTVFGDLTVTDVTNPAAGHITASGNISASGNIIGLSGSLSHLDMSGNIMMADNSFLVSKNQSTTNIKLANDDGWQINANGTPVVTFGAQGAIFNESSVTQADFRVESNDDEYAFHIDSGLNAIELGRQSDTHVTASGNISSSGVILSSNISSLTTTTGSLLNSINAISVTTGSLLNSINAISIVTGSYAITGSDVIFNHITASGNISGSATSVLTIPEIKGIGDSTGLEVGGYISSSELYVGDTTNFVSASLGNLNVSGIIASSNISSLTTTTGSLLNSVDLISATTGSLLNSVDLISATTGSLLNSVNAISIVTGSYAVTGSNVEFGSGSFDYIVARGESTDPPDTFIRLANDAVEYFVGGQKFLTMFEYGSNSFYGINTDQEDINFNIRGNSDANLFRTDAGLDAVAIGSNTYTSKFSVNGNTHLGGHITASGDISGSSGNILGFTSASITYISASRIDVDGDTIKVGGETFNKTLLQNVKDGFDSSTRNQGRGSAVFKSGLNAPHITSSFVSASEFIGHTFTHDTSYAAGRVAVLGSTPGNYFAVAGGDLGYGESNITASAVKEGFSAIVFNAPYSCSLERLDWMVTFEDATAATDFPVRKHAIKVTDINNSAVTSLNLSNKIAPDVNNFDGEYREGRGYYKHETYSGSSESLLGPGDSLALIYSASAGGKLSGWGRCTATFRKI